MRLLGEIVVLLSYDYDYDYILGRDRGVRHWQEYRRTSELKYGIYSNHISVYVRVFSYIVLIT